MAWNPSPEVAAARDFAKKFGYRRVIILFDNAAAIGFTSYGETSALCASANRIGNELWAPFEEALIKESRAALGSGEG